MDPCFRCPECSEELIPYQKFYQCRHFHRVPRNAFGNLMFPGKGIFCSVEECRRKETLFQRDLLADLRSEICEETARLGKDEGRRLFCDFPDSAFCRKLQGESVFLFRERKRARFLQSDETVQFCFGTTRNLRDNSFRALFSFSAEPSEAARLLRQQGLLFLLTCSENFARELFYCGFPAFPGFEPKTLAGFRTKRILRFSKRIYLNPEEADTLCRVFAHAPLKEKDAFGGGFVTTELFLSVYQKEPRSFVLFRPSSR